MGGNCHNGDGPKNKFHFSYTKLFSGEMWPEHFFFGEIHKHVFFCLYMMVYHSYYEVQVHLSVKSGANIILRF